MFGPSDAIGPFIQAGPPLTFDGFVAFRLICASEPRRGWILPKVQPYRCIWVASSTIAAWVPTEAPESGPCSVGPASAWTQPHHELANIVREPALARVLPLSSAICRPVFHPARRHGLCCTSSPANIVPLDRPAPRPVNKGPLPFHKTEELRGRVRI